MPNNNTNMSNMQDMKPDTAAASLSFSNELLRDIMPEDELENSLSMGGFEDSEPTQEELSQNEAPAGEGSGMEATQEMQSPTEEIPTPTQETEPIEEEGSEVEEEKPDFESFKEELMKELDKKFEGLTESIKDTLSK